MKKKNYIGVWMDHSHATLIQPKEDQFISQTVELAFNHVQRMEAGAKSEHILHNKEQQKQSAFYDQIKDGIKNYDGILLFGPTHAKNELNNLLKADHHFDQIMVDVKDTDKLTENQQHAYVKKHFRL
jgi:hypothetical protein